METRHTFFTTVLSLVTFDSNGRESLIRVGLTLRGTYMLLIYLERNTTLEVADGISRVLSIGSRQGICTTTWTSILIRSSAPISA